MGFLSSLFDREELFFVLLQKSATNLKETAAKLLDLMEGYEAVPEKVAEIKRLEEAGDSIIHTIMTSLHKTFITPIDREDIATLGERMDDIVDSIEEAALIMLNYQIDEPTEGSKEISRIIVRCAVTLELAMEILPSKGAKLGDILPLAAEVTALANKANHVASQSLGELLNNDSPALYVLKWKEVYSLLEEATNFCGDAAKMLEGIVLKHA